MKDNFQICSRCIYDSRVPNISFDEEGVCNYCHQVTGLEETFKTGTPEGEAELQKIFAQIKEESKNKKYDCIVGVSGGTDSSYLLIKALEWGLRPLAVHYDNTWNSAIATENIRKVTSTLNVDLYTYVVDNKEADDIFRSFLLAGVPEFDASTDLGFVQTLRKAAAKYNVKYILEGHSFREEGVSPIGKNYFDGMYVKSIHDKYGKVKMKTYPLMTFFQFMKWTLFYRQKYIRPLWYINYTKADAKKVLKEKTGWEDYGGHHLENRSAAYVHTLYLPHKFKMDMRNLALAALARTGGMPREEALLKYNSPIEEPEGLEEYVKKRLNISDEEYVKIMNGPQRSFRDFKTYKKRFERLRPMFYLLAKVNIIPRSFYLKYCFPIK
ncbi:N-acetyl sugar amidotransferase [Pedobacter sp.]|uniref:N-acetyl sugar amidotransferase n=1 Tax=Pedobacter sp. TaxID=1411316 RepID=UPI003BA8779B